MLSHTSIWSAIDELATRHNLSPSGLAKRAGLDPTSFNPSKRFKTDGRPRWPSTESIAKILDATNTPASTFFADQAILQKKANSEHKWMLDLLLGQRPSSSWPVSTYSDGQAKSRDARSPALPPVQAAWRNRYPAGDSLFPFFILQVRERQFAPVFRSGSLLLLANDLTFAEGDRVIVSSTKDGLILGDVLSMKQQSVCLSSPIEKGNIASYRLSSVEWVARLLWASQ